MKYISPNLSEYVDPFLKYQTKTCKSYVRYTSECLLKLKSLSTVPSTSILFITDVNSPYTNIDDEEGADVSYKYIEKKISSVIKVDISQSIKTISFLDVCSTPNQRTLSTAVFPKPLNTLVTLSIELNIKLSKSWWLWDTFMFSSMFSVTRVSYACGRFVSIQLIFSIKVFKLFHKRSPR